MRSGKPITEIRNVIKVILFFKILYTEVAKTQTQVFLWQFFDYFYEENIYGWYVGVTQI